MKFKNIGLASVLTVGASCALATTNDCSYELNYVKNGTITLAYAQQNYPECFASSSPVANQQIAATSFGLISAISSSVGANLLNGGGQGPRKTATLSGSGMAAGGTGKTWNVWGNLSDSSVTYSATTSASVKLNTRTDTLNAVMGADTSIAPDLVVGASVAIDNGSGRLNAATTTVANGYTFAPYLGWQINKNLALDASVGLGFGDHSQSGGTQIDSTRVFYATNLNYVEWVGNWQLTGKVGYLAAQERFADSKLNGATVVGTGNTSSLDQIRGGIEAGYWYSNGVMPYVGVTYTTDVSRTRQAGVPWDKSAFLLAAGVNFFSLKDGVTGGLAFTTEAGRSHTTNSTLMANVSLRF